MPSVDRLHRLFCFYTCTGWKPFAGMYTGDQVQRTGKEMRVWNKRRKIMQVKWFGQMGFYTVSWMPMKSTGRYSRTLYGIRT